MGMSTHIKGFILPTNPEYIKHANVLKACNEAGIKKLPKETADYFGEDYPELSLLEDKLAVRIPCHEFNADMMDGFDVKLSELPPGIDIIRFYNSY